MKSTVEWSGRFVDLQNHYSTLDHSQQYQESLPPHYSAQWAHTRMSTLASK